MHTHASGATLLSFVVALLYFGLEVGVYKTISWKGALSPGIIASECEWPAHEPQDVQAQVLAWG